MGIPRHQIIDILFIASVCHEANRAYCAALGDNSQLPWIEAPEWQINSAVKGVRFHMDSPNTGPAASHNSWLEEKRIAGWKYGPIKDPETKQHPCFVPYEQLPKEQQAKDYIFCAIVKAMEVYGAIDEGSPTSDLLT